MPWSMRTEGGQVLVVRQRDKKIVGRHKNRKRALAQMKVLYSLEKAQFASRSEAGRYAANMRWKNQTPKQKLDALGSKELKIVEIRGDETFKKKDGSVTRRATLTVLDDDGKELQVDVRSEGVKGSQFIQVEAKRGNKQIGYLWAQTDYDGQYGQKGKVAIGQVDVISSERRKGVATALMRLGKRYNIGSEPIYHSTVLTTAGAAFARDTEIEKASFGGDRSAAGRYAANMRWQGQGQKEQEQVGIDGYPKINVDLDELFTNTPILNSPLGKTMDEINKEVSERESESRTEDEILPMLIFSLYLGKGSNEFYGALNRHLRKGNPLKDSLREKLSEEDEERVERLEREIRQLERDQDEDDDTDNSAEIESLRDEVDEIEEQVNDSERIDADDWDYDAHSESDFDSQYGSVTISINGEDVKMPKVVAYRLMDDAFQELSMVMPSNLRAYRGIDPATIASLEASVGKTVEDLGFCSTSTSPNKAIAFSGVGVPMQSQLQTEYYKEGDTLSSDKRIATILIPKGLKVVMPNRGGEEEVILNRGTQFKVVGVNEMGPILEVVANEENK